MHVYPALQQSLSAYGNLHAWRMTQKLLIVQPGRSSHADAAIASVKVYCIPAACCEAPFIQAVVPCGNLPRGYNALACCQNMNYGGGGDPAH